MKETYLHFQQGEHHYAMENNNILRILPATDLWELPIKEPFIKGIVLVDEHLTAIIDTEEILFQQPTNSTAYYIIVEAQKEYLGLCAEHIYGTIAIKEQAWCLEENGSLPFSCNIHDQKIYHLQLEDLDRR